MGWQASNTKPEYLLERIILASTKEGDYILDPFVGVVQQEWLLNA